VRSRFRPGFILLILFVFFSAGGSGLFASGKKEAAAAKDPVNPEWALCITAPDVSALPPSRQIIGDAALRNLADALMKLEFRLRGEDEYAY
jgi:hypothetical protein